MTTFILIKNDPELKAAFMLLGTRFQSFLLDRDKKKKNPGMSVAIVYDQEMIYTKGYGYVDLEKKVPAKSYTIV
jgi:CubicO group peptidase (beta-lactamase class C family)